MPMCDYILSAAHLVVDSQTSLTDAALAVAEGHIVALDITQPNAIPIFDPISYIVYAANGKDTILTMVGGKPLYTGTLPPDYYATARALQNTKYVDME